MPAANASASANRRRKRWECESPLILPLRPGNALVVRHPNLPGAGFAVGAGMERNGCDGDRQVSPATAFLGQPGPFKIRRFIRFT